MQPAAPQFAAFVAGASDPELAAALAAARERILEELFAAAPERFDAGAADGAAGVLEYRIAEEGAAREHRWQLALGPDGCTAARDGAAAPDAVVHVGEVDFLRLITRQLSGPELFMTGRIVVEGDLVLAARFASFFRAPA